MGSGIHVTIDAIGRLARRELPPEKVLRIARHISECGECAALARDVTSLGDADDLFDVEDLEHPRVDPDLAAYVDLILPLARRAEIAAHLETCERCRQDVADLERIRASSARKTPWLAYAAAAVLVIALAGITLWPRGPLRSVPQPPSPRSAAPVPIATTTATTYDRPEWQTAVDEARRTGRVPRAAILAEIHASPETLRGNDRATPAKLDPAGVVIETTTPRFTWTAFDHARYVVSVFDGDRKVASSGKITTAWWIPASPLARGKTFTWQVEVARDGKSEIIPAPPSPPAMFHIIDEATARDLDDARRRYPTDHLLLGVLYARAGLESSAREELSRGGQAPSPVPRAGSLRR